MPKLPNGYFLEEGLVWYNLPKSGQALICKGFELQIADQLYSSNSSRNAAAIAYGKAITVLPEDYQLQFRFDINSDYKSFLEQYRSRTETAVERAWDYQIRSEREFRCRYQMEEGFLRHERVHFFVSKKIDTSLSKVFGRTKRIEKNVQSQIDIERAAFRSIQALLSQALGEYGRVIPIDTNRVTSYFNEFLNPSRNGNEFTQEGELDFSSSIQSFCMCSDGNAVENASFHFDNRYHSIFVLTDWPSLNSPGQFYPLINLPFNELSIVANIYRLNRQDEIAKADKHLVLLQADQIAEKKLSLSVAQRKQAARLAEIAEGNITPYNVLYTIRVWDRSLEGLSTKIDAIKTGLSIAGFKYYNVTRFVTAVNLWAQTWPGYTCSNYRGWDIYGSEQILSVTLPFSSTFRGYLNDAEAIYHGNNRNLVGVKLKFGNTPQHFVVFGGTRSGKSAFVNDLLTQVGHSFGKIVLIESGLTYGIYTETQGCKPIIFQPDGELTINYFDTHKLPLTADVLSSATGICLRMLGDSSDEERNRRRSAIIGEYINRLYEDCYLSWSRSNENRFEQITQQAFLIEKYRTKNLKPGSTFLDAFIALRDTNSFENKQANEKETVAWSKTKEGARRIRDLCFAFFTPSEFPTHSALCQLMLHGRMRHHSKEDVDPIASMLSMWTARNGQRGKLFDGTNNVDFSARVLHLELGYIPESAKDLRSCIAFLLANSVRQHILTLPRNIWKLALFEEMPQFANFPGGAQIVADGYTTFGKYSTVLGSVVQQYAQFRASGARPAIMGNSSQFFIFRQSDKEDLNDLGKELGLSNETVRTIGNYPSPEHLPANDRYSNCTYFARNAAEPINGTLRNYVSAPMLLCASSDGAVYEERKKQLSKYPDVVDGLFELSRPNILQRTTLSNY